MAPRNVVTRLRVKQWPAAFAVAVAWVVGMFLVALLIALTPHGYIVAEGVALALALGCPIVARSLANWDQHQHLLCQTVADVNQADPVRLGAMLSMDRYGRELSVLESDFHKALKTALRSENKELRQAAIVTLRHSPQAAFVWLDLLCDDRHKEEQPLILRTWIDTLGSVTGRKLGPEAVRPLGTVMDEYLIGQTEYRALRDRYGEK